MGAKKEFVVKCVAAITSFPSGTERMGRVLISARHVDTRIIACALMIYDSLHSLFRSRFDSLCICYAVKVGTLSRQ